MCRYCTYKAGIIAGGLTLGTYYLIKAIFEFIEAGNEHCWIPFKCDHLDTAFVDSTITFISYMVSACCVCRDSTETRLARLEAAEQARQEPQAGENNNQDQHEQLLPASPPHPM